MDKRAVFYQLTHKFVNNDEKIPENARQVMYYSLAIGHHVGVMDCFKSLLEIPLDDYRRWIERLPDGVGRKKMEGLLKWGEIEINASHAGELIPTFTSTLPLMSPLELDWSSKMISYLKQMTIEPAFYLMVRTRP